MLSLFQLENNDFIEKFSIKLLCGDGVEDKRTIILKDKTLEYLKYLFAYPKNYKAIYKISRIYDRFQLDQPCFTSSLKIICSKLAKLYEGPNDTLAETQEFYARGLGISGAKFRGDSIVIMGKHPIADIQFPAEDKNVDDISAIISLKENEFRIIDCSKKNFTGIKLIPNIPYKIYQGAVFNIAQMGNFEVLYIENDFDSENNKTHSKLTFVFIDGPQEGRIQNLNTKGFDNQMKRSFILGKGGKGTSPDIFCSLDGFVSSKHLLINFNEQAEWEITDCASKNGTFSLLKNGDKFRQKVESDPISLFSDSSPDKASLIVSYYGFFIRKE